MVDTDGVVVPTTFEVTKVTGTLNMDKFKPVLRLKRKDVTPEVAARDTAAYGYNAELVKFANKVETNRGKEIMVEVNKSMSTVGFIAGQNAIKSVMDSKTAYRKEGTEGTKARKEFTEAKNIQLQLMSTPEYKALMDLLEGTRVRLRELTNEGIKLRGDTKLEVIKATDEADERRRTREEAAMNRKWTIDHALNMDKISLVRARTMLQYSKRNAQLAVVNARRMADKEHMEGVQANIILRDKLARERDAEQHNRRLELIEKRNMASSPLNKLISMIGVPRKDLEHLWLAVSGKASIMPKRMKEIKGHFAKWIGGLAIGGILALAKKTFSTIMGTSKRILGIFTGAAKQAETFKNIMNLALAPLVTMFTLLFVPVLIAMVPLLKTMFGWVINNKEAIMAVGEKLTGIFNSDNLNMVSKALDGVLFVVDSLATMFANNASMIDTTTLAEFISSTILAISNMIQDILLGVVAFCYSPEGRAFITSVAYSVGKIIGSIMETVIALLPVIIGAVAGSVIGLITSVDTYITKAIFNAFDSLDKFFGGAISGFINSIVGLINNAINALNNMNIFGFSPFSIPNINAGMPSQVGSSLSNFIDQGIVNNFHINNNMSLSSFGAIKEVMSTGVY